MAEIINLKAARKRRAKAEKEALAGQNRAMFGRPKAEKKSTQAIKDLAGKLLDGHKRDD